MVRLNTTGYRRGLALLYTDLKKNASIRSESLEPVSGASAITLDVSCYRHKITTGASAGSEDVNVGDGSDAVIGQEILIELTTRSDASDVVNLDHANWVDTDGTTALTNLDMDAAGEFVHGVWNGTKWELIRHNATVAT